MTKLVKPARESVIHIRQVAESDLPILFEFQKESEANDMAAFPARDRDAFMTHWTKIFGDKTVVGMTVVVCDCVASLRTRPPEVVAPVPFPGFRRRDRHRFYFAMWCGFAKYLLEPTSSISA